MTCLLQLRDLLLELGYSTKSKPCTAIVSTIPTISTISTIYTISIVHVISYLGDDLGKDVLQLLRDDSSNVRVLIIVVRAALTIRTVTERAVGNRFSGLLQLLTLRPTSCGRLKIHVGIKILLMLLEVNTAKVRVTAVKHNLVLAAGTKVNAAVIINGDSPPPKKTIDGVEQTYPPTTAEEKLARKNELKARDTLSMDGLYNNLKIYEAKVKGSSSTSQNTQNVAFVSSDITGSTNEAVKTAHGVFAANFKPNASTLPNVDSLSDAVIYSFFAIQGDGLEVADGNVDNESKKISQENMKESRAPKYQDNINRETTKRTAVEGPTNFALMAYTSLGSSSSSSSDSEVSTCSKACLKSYETFKEHYDNLKKDFNKSQINVGAYKADLESVEARLDMYKKNEVIFEENIKVLKLDIMLRDNALTELRKIFEKAEKERDDLKLTLEKFENSSKNLSKLSPPYTGNFMPPKHDLVIADMDEYVFSESVTSIHAVATSEAKTSESKPKFVSEPLIKDWISDSEDENENKSKSKQRKPSFAKVEFVKSNKHVKSPRESVKKVGNNEQAKYPKKNSQRPRGNQRNWNNLMTQKLASNFEFKNKACYVCGSFDHLIKDCDFYKKKMVEKFVWNNARSVNHQNSQRITHPHPKVNFVPKAVLMKSGLKTLNTARQNSSKAAVSVNTARPINIAFPRPTVNCARLVSNVFNRAHSHVRRPFNNFTTNKNSNFNKKVNIVKGNVTTVGPKAVVSDNKGNEANVVKASACWGNPQQELKDKGVIDSGCSRNMTENRSYLTDYEEIDGGFVAFEGSTKEGKITGKGKRRTDFKLTNESHVLLKVPRKDNMYSVDLKNVVPQGGIENIIDLKVKVIRCSNETDFKNKVMNQFCEIKGIKQEFSVARTLQQNGVAERKNRILIEAAKTMLADSKKPALSFMRPFGCPVTIVNTIDHLSKFDGKADEGFFVGYSTNSKAFRLFDTDALTKSMNYKPVVAGNQSNGSAGTKVCDVSGKVRIKIVSGKDYILLLFLTQYPSFYSSSKDSPVVGFKPSGEEEKKDAKHPENEDSKVLNTEKPRVNQEQDANVNSTNKINTVSSTVNAVGIEDNVVDENIVIECVDDPNIPDLEEIVYSDDDEGIGAEVDMTNLDTNIPISPIPTTRVHKDHPVEQIIRDIHSAPQTRRMTKSLTNHEPKKKVWTLVDLPYGKRAIGTKWVYRNKKDERGIVIRNKTRLVTQGYTQEEGIDYNEVFAPVARIKAIRLFLAYALFKYFFVYQMDVKSAFLYGKIEEEAYVYQPLGFEDPEFPDRVYKGRKALYGLHQAPIAWKEMLTEFEKMMHKKFQMSYMGDLTFLLGLQVTQKDDGIFISQDKYVDEILKKFGFSTVKAASTPIETSKPLMKDENAEDIDVHLYRLMIGSLMYLTSSRPDIIFAICACARFQVTPKVSHLHVVKRIFRYLKGQPKLGLWYHKDSLFDLEAYTDSDYAGASLDRKSIIGVKNPVFHSKTKHNEIRLHFIRDSYEKRLIQVIKIHTDHNVADLLTKAFDVSRFQYLIDVCNEIEKLHKNKQKIERAATTASSLEAEQDSGNINRTQFMATLNEYFPHRTGSGSGPRCQDTILGDAEAQIRFEAASKQSNDPPLLRVNTLGSGEDNMKLKELMEFIQNCLKGLLI
ncbi:putative ribonuclease H-like domain-containing protein [Tanacetum coccineum]